MATQEWRGWTDIRLSSQPERIRASAAPEVDRLQALSSRFCGGEPAESERKKGRERKFTLFFSTVLRVAMVWKAWDPAMICCGCRIGRARRGRRWRVVEAVGGGVSLARRAAICRPGGATAGSRSSRRLRGGAPRHQDRLGISPLLTHPARALGVFRAAAHAVVLPITGCRSWERRFGRDETSCRGLCEGPVLVRLWRKKAMPISHPYPENCSELPSKHQLRPGPSPIRSKK